MPWNGRGYDYYRQRSWNWQAKDLAFLKAAGWANMVITITSDGAFTMTGDNPYGMGGKLDIRGSVTLGPEASAAPD